MGNQTFCNCVSLHPKPEKTIDLEKIIKNSFSNKISVKNKKSKIMFIF